jgi:hypothetical protein
MLNPIVDIDHTAFIPFLTSHSSGLFHLTIRQSTVRFHLHHPYTKVETLHTDLTPSNV